MPLWLNVWDDINIENTIKNRFKTKVIIKNDINLAALGESHFGSGVKYKNLMFVSIDMGVGAGIIINDQLYEGSRLAAGEIGYFSSRIEDSNFDHKYYGPLESRISIAGIINNIKNDLNSGCESLINDLTSGKLDEITTKVINEAIRQGDSYVISAMLKVSEELGITLANLAILLDLEFIILGGQLFEFEYDFFAIVSKYVQQLVPLDTKISRSTLEPNAVIYGAFAAGLEYVHNNILHI